MAGFQDCFEEVSTDNCPPCEQQTKEAYTEMLFLWDIAESIIVGLLIALAAGLVTRFFPFSWLTGLFALAGGKLARSSLTVQQTQSIVNAITESGLTAGVFDTLIAGSKAAVKAAAPEIEFLLTKAARIANG
jgi:hypothetical protein